MTLHRRLYSLYLSNILRLKEFLRPLKSPEDFSNLLIIFRIGIRPVYHLPEFSTILLNFSRIRCNDSLAANGRTMNTMRSLTRRRAIGRKCLRLKSL